MVRNGLVAAGIVVSVFMAVPGRGETGQGSGEGATEQERQRERQEERLREEACNCCMSCMAATRDVQGKEEGPPAENGCKECCRRCGTTDLPTKRKVPPEVVR